MRISLRILRFLPVLDREAKVVLRASNFSAQNPLYPFRVAGIYSYSSAIHTDCE